MIELIIVISVWNIGHYSHGSLKFNQIMIDTKIELYCFLILPLKDCTVLGDGVHEA